MEATKLSIKGGDDAEKDRATTVLLDVLAESLKLLHPLLPFITEEIYGKLPNTIGKGLLITASYPEYDENPEYDEKREYPEAEQHFAFLQELVRQVRTLRSECTINPDKRIHVLARVSSDGGRYTFLKENAELVKLLAGIGELDIEAADPGLTRPQGSIGLVGSGFEAFVYIAEAADPAVLQQKFTKEAAKDRKFIASLEAKLANEQFLKNAPPELVRAEKLKLEDALQRIGKLESYIRAML